MTAIPRALRGRRGRSALQLVCLLTALVGAIDLLAAVLPALPERLAVLEGVFPLDVPVGARFFGALASFLLFSLAVALLRRKRQAWLITCLLLAASVVSHLLTGLNIEESLASSALLVLLLWMRPLFTADSDRPSVLQGIRVLLLAVVFTLAYGTLGFYLLDWHYSVNFDGPQALAQTLAMFFTDHDAGLVPITRHGQRFAESIHLIGGVTLGYALVMLLRPVLQRPGASEAESLEASRIVRAHAQASLAAFSLLPDKTLFFSPSRHSLTAFGVFGRSAVVLGDPIGPADDLRRTISAFREHCFRNDWRPAFYQTLPNHLDLYRELGFRALKIGEEGIVDLAAFSLSGKAAAHLRTPINKLRKLGYRVEFHAPPLSDALIEELRPVSSAWLQRMKGAEKKFSLGWFDPGYLRGTEVAVVRTPDGMVSAFANLLVGVRPDEVAIDLMRSHHDLEPGTMDVLFSSLLLHYQQAGFKRFNLGLSALSGLGSSETSPRLEKAMAALADHLDRFYSFRGLHSYKAKFRPSWEPRYLIYPSLAALPDVILALMRLDSGDRLLDYLGLPHRVQTRPSMHRWPGSPSPLPPPSADGRNLEGADAVPDQSDQRGSHPWPG